MQLFDFSTSSTVEKAQKVEAFKSASIERRVGMDLGPILRDGGAGVALVMAGVGAYRFFTAGTHSITGIPHSLERGVEAMERGVKAIENQSAILNQVLELKDLTVKLLGQVAEIRNEREEIGRELRIMSRRIEVGHGGDPQTES